MFDDAKSIAIHDKEVKFIKSLDGKVIWNAWGINGDETDIFGGG